MRRRENLYGRDDTFRTYILQNSLDQYEMQFVPVNFEKDRK